MKTARFERSDKRLLIDAMFRHNLERPRAILVDESKLLPEYNLLYAVLEQALLDWLKVLKAKGKVSRSYRRQLTLWLLSDSTSHILDCRSICDALGIDVRVIRKHMAGAKMKRSYKKRASKIEAKAEMTDRAASPDRETQPDFNDKEALLHGREKFSVSEVEIGLESGVGNESR